MKRFWDRVQIGDPDECWPWTGGCSSGGYGVIGVEGRSVSTHRLAFQLSTGLDPGDLYVCHSCDNPPCCNPGHLYAGTPSQNQQDCKRRGRRPNRHGSRHHLAKLTEEQVLEIRRRRASGERVRDLVREFPVSPSTISKIANNPDRNWSMV